MKNVLNELIIVKRSGQRVSFNGAKIALAIKNAFDTVDNYHEEDINKVYGNVLNNIELNYKDRKTINVEDIQDMIESELKNSKYLDVYESFNSYRMKRAASREVFSVKQQHKFMKAVEKLVLAVKTDNNNKPLNTLSLFGKTVSSEFAKSYLIDNKHIKAHEEGSIFIHNLDDYALGVVKELNVDISNINYDSNYFSKLTNILLGLKDEVSGEILIDKFSESIEKYALYKYKDIFKTMMFNNLTVNGFMPYINVRKIEDLINKESSYNFDLEPYLSYLQSDNLVSSFKIISELSKLELDKFMKDKLTSFIKSLDNNNCILSNKDYSIIVKDSNITDLIFDIIKDMKLNNVWVGYDKQVNIPNTYVSKNSSFRNGLVINDNIYSEKEALGRMVLAKTSINLARIVLKHKNDQAMFEEELSNVLELVKGSLLSEFELIANKYKDSYNYLFDNNVIKESEKLEAGGRIRKVLKNGILVINLVGLEECKKTLDKNNYEYMINMINERITEFTDNNRLNFRISHVDLEGVNKTFLSIDKAIYGTIKNITDKAEYSHEHIGI